MKKVLLIIIMLVALSQAASAQSGQEYDVNFKNITMKEFITFVASFTGINIVYNEADLRGTVSIASQYPMKAAAIMDIFYATLRNNNLSAVQENGYIRVVPDKDMPNYIEDFTTKSKIDIDKFVTTIIVLKNYNATALVNSLSRVKSRFGNVEAIRGINAILVKDFGGVIEKMRTIAIQMDTYASSYNLYSITIENATASKIEQQIMKLFNELMKNSITGQIPIVLSDDASNVLVIAATDDDYNKIQYLINQLDVKTVAENNLPRIFYIKYTNANDMETVLNKIFSGTTVQAQPGGVQNAARSGGKANVSSDNTTNSIIALGDAEFYANLEHMIKMLDIPRKQVYVEALIMETSLDNNQSFGVSWFGGGADGDNYGGIGNFNQGASVIGSEGIPVSNIAGGFSAGIIGNIISYNGKEFPSIGAFMNVMEGDSSVNIINNPQILMLDNEEGEAFSGENRPYLTSTKSDSNDNQIQSFDYRDVGVRLKVKPHVVGEEMILLDIDLEVKKIAPSTSAESTQPTTLNRTTKTKVQLYDRSIMLISGLMKDDSSVGTSGIPFLRSIPILGWLFKTENSSSEKTNLMIFITSYVLRTRDDMNDMMERRTTGTSMFNAKVNKKINDKLGDNDTYIPMQKEIQEQYGIGQEISE